MPIPMRNSHGSFSNQFLRHSSQSATSPMPHSSLSASFAGSLGGFIKGSFCSMPAGYTPELPASWTSSGFYKAGSTAEITSLLVSSSMMSIDGELGEKIQCGLRKKHHDSSRASMSSYLSAELAGSGRGSVAELTSLVVEHLQPQSPKQLERQRSVAGSVCVFITAGYAGKQFIFEIACRMELRVVIIDSEDSWSRSLVDDGTIEDFIPMDIGEELTSFNTCVAAIAEVKAKFGRLDGIVSFSELAQPLVARLTDHFHLPGNTYEATATARDKYKSRLAFEKAGLPTPKNYLIVEEEDIQKASDHVGYPAVIKPIFGAASIGVVRVDRAEELPARWQAVRQQLMSARVVNGALQEGTAAGDAEGLGAVDWIDLSIMMESYLDGPEVDVDVIIGKGKCYYSALTDNWPTIEPYFNETGSNCPSILPEHQQKELVDLAVASCHALGLQNGVFHVEGKYTSHGPRLIEVNCRMGGGPVHVCNKLVYGVDLVVEQLILSCGGEPAESLNCTEPLCNIAEYSMNAPRSGYIAHTNFLDEWCDNPNLVYARPLVVPRQLVCGPQDGMPTWLCEVMCTAATVEEGIRFVKQIEATCAFPIVDVLDPHESGMSPDDMLLGNPQLL